MSSTSVPGETFPRKSLHTEISPLRYASVEMTKGRVVMARSRRQRTETQVPPLRFAPVGMTILPSPGFLSRSVEHTHLYLGERSKKGSFLR